MTISTIIAILGGTAIALCLAVCAPKMLRKLLTPEPNANRRNAVRAL
jgi:hypothetical protein